MTREEYLSKLNEQQRSAVEYCDGPQLVIAGAGSGKTRVLTYKIVHLLANGYEANRILALTFTNKAANEMKERIAQLVDRRTASHLWMGTFHSIFSRLLRRHAQLIGFNSDFTIYDAADSKSLIKSIIKDMQLDDKIYKPSVVQSAISMAKNALLSPHAYAMDRDIMEADKRARRPLIYEIYATYSRRCAASGVMDFDDLLYYTNLLLRDNPDVKEHYRQYFQYILVDEYQDTNFAQHVIVSELCGDGNRLCVVGDDAQSIYSFRGANISNILNLQKGFPTLRVFKLEQNYRSTQNIINAANSLIAKNQQQIPKNVFSRNALGDPIEVINCFSDYEESSIVANRVSQLKMKTHDSYEDFAILYRTNAQSRLLEEALRKRNIPYRIYGGLSFYQRKEVKDAIAYMRLTVNPNDDEALKRIINYPARGIGETTVNKISKAATEHNTSMWTVLCDPEAYELNINKGTAGKLADFASLIGRFIEANEGGMNARDLTRKIINETRLIAVLVHDNTPESISKQENLEELLNGTSQFVTERTEQGEADNTRLVDFLADVSLATDMDQDDNAAEERVTLMTVHAAKGLEFGNVIVVGVEDDLFPSAMSKASIYEIEEERRLLYVAITRAKHHCVLTFASQRYRNGQTMATLPSPFLRDIDARYMHLMSGSMTLYDNEPSIDYHQSYHSSSTTGRRGGGYGKPFVRPQAKPFVAPPPTAFGSSHQSASTASLPGGDTQLHSAQELKCGMMIKHSRFGLGKIIDIDTGSIDHKIQVQFAGNDTKTLLLKFAKFTIES